MKNLKFFRSSLRNMRLCYGTFENQKYLMQENSEDNKVWELERSGI